MSKVLYVEASPRKTRSRSIEVAKYFLELYKTKNPADMIKTVDLWKEKLPEFDESSVLARYKILGKKDYTKEEEKSWKNITEYIEDFKSYDKYIISSSMWNFSIPYKLKNWIDVIWQPSYTFTYSQDKGYEGLVKDKPVVLILARGGEYPAGTEAENIDFQKRYLEFVLGFIGFKNIKTITIEPTLAGEEIAVQKVKEAKTKADIIIKDF